MYQKSHFFNVPFPVVITYLLVRSNEGDEMDATYTICGEKRNNCRVYVRKSERKWPLGKLRHNWGILIRWILEK